jgi:hypothetical protein
MQNNNSGSQDDLSSFEGRLAEWRPDSKGLHSDQMLYAAGLAAGKRRKGRIAWPALCGVLALSTVVSFGWGLSQRSENLALARGIRNSHSEGLLDSAGTGLADSTSTYTPASNDYFHLRHRVEENLGELLASSHPIVHQSSESTPVKTNILKAGQHDRWRDQ